MIFKQHMSNERELYRLSFDQLRNRIQDRFTSDETIINLTGTYSCNINELTDQISITGSNSSTINELTDQINRIVMIIDEVSIDSSNSRLTRNTNSYNKAIIIQPCLSLIDKEYTCYYCFESFCNTTEYTTHLELCRNNNDQNECTICFNRIQANRSFINCHGCKKNLGCRSCINNMIFGRKSYSNEKIGNENAKFCSIRCPMCRQHNNIRLEVYEPDSNLANDTLLHNIKTFINQNPNRKTIDKNVLIEFINKL